MAGDFNGDGRTDLALTDRGDPFRGLPDPSVVSVLLGQRATEPSGLRVTYPVGSTPCPSWQATSMATAARPGHRRTTISETVSVLLGKGDGTFVDPSQFATTPHATPLVADLNGDGTNDVL